MPNSVLEHQIEVSRHPVVRFTRAVIANPKVNQFLTSAVILISFYWLICTLFGLKIAHPLTPPPSVVSKDSNVSLNVASLFVLLVCSHLIGFFFSLGFVPPETAALILGVCFRNVSFMQGLIQISEFWQFITTESALSLLIVRLCTCLDLPAIGYNPGLPFSLSLFPTLVECISIAAVSILVWKFSAQMGILFGLTLSATSFAVISRVLTSIRTRKLEINKSIPMTIENAVCIEGLFLIAAIAVSSEIVFIHDSVLSSIGLTIGEIALGMLVGFLSGAFLSSFPKLHSSHYQFTRGLLLLVSTTVYVIGSQSIGLRCGGIFSALLLGITSTLHWRLENRRNIQHLASSFGYIWDVLALPLLFSVAGYQLDISLVTSSLVGVCFALICLGLFLRLLAAVVFAGCSNLDFKQQIIVAVSFLPKGTLQMAMAPAILVASKTMLQYKDEAELLLLACVLTSLASGTVISVLLHFFAPILLVKKNEIRSSIENQNNVETGRQTSNPNQNESAPRESPRGIIEAAKDVAHL